MNEFSTQWVSRIPDPPLEEILKSSLGLIQEGYLHQLNFYYPIEGGIYSIIENLIDPINDKIVTSFEVNKIIKIGERWLVSDGRNQYYFDKIIITIPLPELINIIPDLPKRIIEKILKLKYNSIKCICFGLNKKLNINYSWLYIPQNDVLTHRVSFPSNYSPFCAPEGKSSILVEITYFDDINLNKQTDAEIIKRVEDDLIKINLIEKNDVIFKDIFTYKYAYVIDTLDTKNLKKEINEYFSTQGIDVVGRFAEWEYMNMDDVIKSCMEYCNKI